MSSGGATLQGSFSGATGTITEVGFYYGTDPSSLTKASASGTSSPFSKTLSGLTRNTTYYYKAYVIESGEERLGGQQSFTTKKEATAVVTTNPVTNLAPTTVTFNGQFANASGTVSDHGFYYRKATESTWQVAHLDSAGSSGSFTANVSGLAEGTAYQVKAWVEEYDENQGQYVDRFGEVVSFTTTTSSVVVPTYLDDYGIPDLSGRLSGTGTSGTNTNDSLNDHWFRYNTNNNKQQVAVHTYTHSTYGETVNYVVYYDETRYAPLWTAHTMNTTYWPDNGVERTSSGWFKDPAISLDQIEGLTDNNTYSRGHFTASNYRKSTDAQNAQTFYYTNKAPQYQSGFNSGVWSSLESRVKEIAPSGTTMLYVVTGVLYEGTINYMNSNTKSDGKTHSVPIPSHFYKCIMRCTFSGNTMVGAQGIAFVFTNESHSGQTYLSGVTSINDIEERAGFDFFAKVPDNLEATAEANTNTSWFTSNSNNVSGVYDLDWGSF